MNKLRIIILIIYLNKNMMDALTRCTRTGRASAATRHADRSGKSCFPGLTRPLLHTRFVGVVRLSSVVGWLRPWFIYNTRPQSV